jgi:hypothetical protein
VFTKSPLKSLKNSIRSPHSSLKYFLKSTKLTSINLFYNSNKIHKKPNKCIKFKINLIFENYYSLVSTLKWTLIEFNGHGMVHGETPMGTFLGIPIHEGFLLKKAQIH